MDRSQLRDRTGVIIEPLLTITIIRPRCRGCGGGEGGGGRFHLEPPLYPHATNRGQPSADIMTFVRFAIPT